MGRGNQDNTDQNPHLDVQSCQLHPAPESLMLAVDPIILADILVKPPHRQFFLIVRQPCRGPREVWQEKKRRRRDDDGNDTLDDEEPSPGAQSQTAIQTPRDPRSDQTAERARDERAGREQRGAEPQLPPRIPTAEEVQTAGKIGSLDETQEEADTGDAGKVLRPRRRAADDAPGHHRGGKIDARFPHLVQVQIAGDLHQDVADEEDRHGGLVLIADEVEVRLEPAQPRRGDVVPVQVVHDVHEDDHGNQARVDLADEILLHVAAFVGTE